MEGLGNPFPAFSGTPLHSAQLINGDWKVVPNVTHGCTIDYENNFWTAGNGEGIIQEYTHDGKLLMQIGNRGVADTSDGTLKGIKRCLVENFAAQTRDGAIARRRAFVSSLVRSEIYFSGKVRPSNQDIRFYDFHRALSWR